MEISIKYQLITTLFSVVLGLFIGLIYDCFKITRRFLLDEISVALQNKVCKINFPLIKLNFNRKKFKFKHKFTYFTLDILFFIVIIPIVQIFIYAASNGIVRWYIFLGIIAREFFFFKLLPYMVLSKVI